MLNYLWPGLPLNYLWPGLCWTTSDQGYCWTTSDQGYRWTTSDQGYRWTTSDQDYCWTTSDQGYCRTTSDQGYRWTTSDQGIDIEYNKRLDRQRPGRWPGLLLNYLWPGLHKNVDFRLIFGVNTLTSIMCKAEYCWHPSGKYLKLAHVWEKKKWCIFLTRVRSHCWTWPLYHRAVTVNYLIEDQGREKIALL